MSYNSTVDISGLNRAEVLATLYNNSRPLGMGFLHYDPTPMTINEAATLLKDGKGYFDYLKGRVMKISFDESDELSTYLYNRDNGEGKVEELIYTLRKNMKKV